tara:strand:- start:3196 stop:4971 length:1776 start_codon:yes stop_codon:yes gene_type:complete
VDILLITTVYFLGINFIIGNFIFDYYLLLILISTTLFILTGQYKAITRYIDNRFLYIIFLRVFSSLLILEIISKIIGLQSFSGILLISFWLLISFSLCFVRSLFKNLIFFIKDSTSENTKIAIYGAGEAGNQLLASLKLDKRFKTLYFFDDDKNKQNRYISGIPIKNPKNIVKHKREFDQIFIAIPSLSKTKMKNLLTSLENLNMPLFQIPTIEDISSGRASVGSIKPIAVENILGRDPVEIDYHLLKKEINGKVICITGAAGSIGSELCRQILKLNPKLIVMIDNNEFSLYKLKEEFEGEAINIPTKVLLGSTTDLIFLKNIFKKEKINIVFHAAAYKHVPLVETNPFQGVMNNVFSTLNICKVSEEFKVEHLLLISTDKAVRPTNIMGTSKRVSELIFQAFSSKKLGTKFCIVRFGNVLGSSGSVVPKFREQIASGGPVTITHPEIVRYFMTIPEATLLVIQSLSLSNGGDILLLDMGKQVKIRDLAIKMIKLSGNTLKDEKNPNGDIEIVYSGLRQGEKLYEELLIDAEAQKTSHSQIFRAKEKSFNFEVLMEKIKIIENSIIKNNLNELIVELKELVPEWDNKNFKL